MAYYVNMTGRNISRAPGQVLNRPNFTSESLSQIMTFEEAQELKYPGGEGLYGNEHIRLLELFKWEEGFGFHLRKVRLDQTPAYRALSYHWGPMLTDDNLIRLKGFRVSKNLWDVLPRIAGDHPGFWWIDALCINQDDDAEKDKQVALMRDIYKRAKQVIVWLGVHDEDSRPALTLVKMIVDRINNGRIDYRGPRSPRKEFSNRELNLLQLPSVNDSMWTSLIKFISRGYFQRIWALQELVMAVESKENVITAFCGDLYFPWGALCVPVIWLRALGWDKLITERLAGKKETFCYIDEMDLITASSMEREIGSRFSLEEKVNMFRQLQSSNPRDKIIALLGLISPKDQVGSAIDIRYGQPVEDFYRDVTGTIITKGQSLKILSSVEDSLLREHQNLPSWVPDWSVCNHGASRTLGNASKGSLLKVEWTPGSKILGVEACIVDEVHLTADEIVTLGSKTNAALLSSFKLLVESTSDPPERWLHSIAEHRPYAEAFWRTLIRDEVNSQRPAPEVYRQHFAAVLLEAFQNKQMSEKWSVPQQWIDDSKREGGVFPGKGRLYLLEYGSKTAYNRFFLTKAGRMGLGPTSTQPGDKVAILSGAEQIFLLRHCGSEFQLVGNGYVHGLMDGEGLISYSEPFEKISII